MFRRLKFTSFLCISLSEDYSILYFITLIGTCRPGIYITLWCTEWEYSWWSWCSEAPEWDKVCSGECCDLCLITNITCLESACVFLGGFDPAYLGPVLLYQWDAVKSRLGNRAVGFSSFASYFHTYFSKIILSWVEMVHSPLIKSVLSFAWTINKMRKFSVLLWKPYSFAFIHSIPKPFLQIRSSSWYLFLWAHLRTIICG